MSGSLRLTMLLELLIISADFGFAVNIEVTVERPGVQSRHLNDPEFEWMGVETFDGVKLGEHLGFNSCFNLSPCNVDGLYQAYGRFSIKDNSELGGAFRTGRHPQGEELTRYKIMFETPDGKGINYFGYHHSAVQWGDTVRVYSGKYQVLQFRGGQELIPLLKGNSKYNGNPNFDSKDSGTVPYVFVNIYCHDCTIDEIWFMTLGVRDRSIITDQHTVGRRKVAKKPVELPLSTGDPTESGRRATTPTATTVINTMATETATTVITTVEITTSPPQETLSETKSAEAKDSETVTPDGSTSDTSTYVLAFLGAAGAAAFVIGTLVYVRIRRLKREKRKDDASPLDKNIKSDLFDQIISNSRETILVL